MAHSAPHPLQIMQKKFIAAAAISASHARTTSSLAWNKHRENLGGAMYPLHTDRTAGPPQVFFLLGLN